MKTVKTITLTYQLKSKVRLSFDEWGDLIDFFIDDKNCIENGDSIVSVLKEIKAAGHDLQLDISKAFGELK